MGALQCPAGSSSRAVGKAAFPWEKGVISCISTGEWGNQLLGISCTPSTSSVSGTGQPAASPTPARSLGTLTPSGAPSHPARLRQAAPSQRDWLFLDNHRPTDPEITPWCPPCSLGSPGMGIPCLPLTAPALPAVTRPRRGHTARVTQSTNSAPFLLHLLEARFDNNLAQRGRAAQRAGWPWILLSSGGAGKISPFPPDKPLGDSSPAGESPAVQMLGRLAQVMVLLIDRCCITIQTRIPVSQLPLWVLRRAGAVLPQCESGVGTERARSAGHGLGSIAGRLQGSRSLPGPAPGTAAGFLRAKDPAGAAWTW